MKVVFFLLTTFIGSAVSVTLKLWADDNACSGDSCTCEDYAQQTCCYCDNELFESMEALERNEAGDYATPLSSQNGNPCAVVISGSALIPVCYTSNNPLVVAGASWNPTTPGRNSSPEFLPSGLSSRPDYNGLLFANGEGAPDNLVEVCRGECGCAKEGR